MLRSAPLLWQPAVQFLSIMSAKLEKQPFTHISAKRNGHARRLLSAAGMQRGAKMPAAHEATCWSL